MSPTSLQVLIEHSPQDKMRMRSLKELLNRNPRAVDYHPEKVFSLLENLLVSETDVRLKVLVMNHLHQLFGRKSITPINWAIKHHPTLLSRYHDHMDGLRPNIIKDALVRFGLSHASEFSERNIRYESERGGHYSCGVFPRDRFIFTHKERLNKEKIKTIKKFSRGDLMKNGILPIKGIPNVPLMKEKKDITTAVYYCVRKDDVEFVLNAFSEFYDLSIENIFLLLDERKETLLIITKRIPIICLMRVEQLEFYETRTKRISLQEY